MENKKLELIGLKIKDLRNIELVDVDLKGKKFIEITGTNGAAKTTLIDSIFLAIQGTKYLQRGYPAWRLVNREADKALLKVTIGNSERTIEIKRSITKRFMGDGTYETGGTLTITDTEGKKLGQEFLDSLISEFTVDPVSFSYKSPADQINILKKLGNIDTTAIDAERARAYEERTIVNRRIKELEPSIRIEPPEAKPIDVSAISTKLQNVLKKNEAIREARRINKEFDDFTALQEQQIIDKIQVIKHLQEEVEKLQEQQGERIYQAQTREDPGTEEPVDKLQLALKNATETNNQAEARKMWEKNKAEYDKKKSEWENYNRTVEEYPEKKRQLIKTSKLPFQNLDFDEEVGILIDGIPFSQKSDAEKIRISTRIGMEMCPEFKIICIKEGSLLDENSFRVIKELAEKHDYQVLVERVGEKEGEDQICMRAGKVISEFSRKTTIGPTAEKSGETL